MAFFVLVLPGVLSLTACNNKSQSNTSSANGSEFDVPNPETSASRPPPMVRKVRPAPQH